MEPDPKYHALRLLIRESVLEGFALFLQFMLLLLIGCAAAGLVWWGLMFTVQV